MRHCWTRALFMALALLAALAALGCGLAEGGAIEGPGYDTPEDAVLAYVDAFDRADLAGMVSTFAVESWAERQDARGLLEMNRGYSQVTSPLLVPAGGEYPRSLIVSWRRGSLMSDLANQYLWYPVVRDLADNGGGRRFEDTDEAEAFFDAWASGPSSGWAGNTRFVEWIDPGALTRGKYYEAGNLVNWTARTVLESGCEDAADLVAHLDLNGRHALLFMTCGRYGGRWYNVRLGNIVSYIRAYSTLSYGLAVAESDEEWRRELLTVAGTAQDYEGAVRIADNLSTDLAGTRWALASVDDGGAAPEIVQSRDELASRVNAAWGELRFTRAAFIAQVCREPKAAEPLMDSPYYDTLAMGAWHAAADGVKLYALNPERELPARFDGDSLALTDAGTGAVYTFRRAPERSAAQARPQGSAGRLEGDGFDSPEAAARAYIDAFNAGDVEAMLSTFAIETWARRFDAKQCLASRRAVNTVLALQAMPVLCESALRAKTAGRYGSLAEKLVRQYLDLGAPAEYPYNGMYVAIDGPEALDAYWRAWRDAPGSRWAGNVEFVGWLDLNELAGEAADYAMAWTGVAEDGDLCGCDDAAPVAAHVRVNGQDAALLLGCGKYGDRWYNLEPGGAAANLLNLRPSCAGLILSGVDRGFSLPDSLNSTPSPQADAQTADKLESGLLESRWRLEQIDGSGLEGLAPAVLDGPDAVKRTQDACAVWGELRFSRCGCVLRMRQSAALLETGLLKNRSVSNCYAWSPTADGVTLTITGKHTATAVIDGTRLVYTDPRTNIVYTYTRY